MLWAAVLFLVLAAIAPSLQAGTTMAARPRQEEDGGRQRNERDGAGQIAAEFLVTDPITIQLGTGNTTTYLATDKDYIIKLPSGTERGSTAIIGGRNVLIADGHIEMPRGSTDLTRRALYVKNATGTVRIEDVFIEGTEGAYFDAIAIAAPMPSLKSPTSESRTSAGRSVASTATSSSRSGASRSLMSMDSAAVVTTRASTWRRRTARSAWSP